MTWCDSPEACRVWLCLRVEYQSFASDRLRLAVYLVAAAVGCGPFASEPAPETLDLAAVAI